MRAKLDETLKACFSGREQPPPEVRAALEAALRATSSVAIPGVALGVASGVAPEAASSKGLPGVARVRGAKRETRWVWVIVLYAALFSVAHIFVAWLFTGNEIIVFAFAVSFLFSTISAGVITVACQRERTKGGLNNGTA